jgi:predicted HicB family RNase H-like nuclease
MPPKKTGLAAFTGSQESAARDRAADSASFRTKAKGETVSITIRLSRDQWERAHQLALAEGVSLNRLAIHALSKVFQEKGLPGL